MDSYSKAPDARLDYGKDWGPFLATTDGDTITTASWELPIPVGLTIEDQGMMLNVHRAFISGGTLGECYRVTSRVVTAQGRIDLSSILVLIRET